MTTHLEDDVRAALHDRLGAAQPSAGFAARVHTAVERRRRRVTGLSAVGAAFATIAVVGGVVVGFDQHRGLPDAAGSPIPSTVHSQSVTATPDGDETQVVRYKGVTIDVPAAWKIWDVRCATPVHDTVLILDGRPIEACLFPQPPGLTVVTITSLDQPTAQDEASVATTDVLVDGLPGRRGVGVPPMSRTELHVLVLTANGVVISVESPDPERAERLLDSVHVVFHPN